MLYVHSARPLPVGKRDSRVACRRIRSTGRLALATKIENLMVASSAGRQRFLSVIKALEAGNNAVPVVVPGKPGVLPGFPEG